MIILHLVMANEFADIAQHDTELVKLFQRSQTYL